MREIFYTETQVQGVQGNTTFSIRKFSIRLIKLKQLHVGTYFLIGMFHWLILAYPMCNVFIGVANKYKGEPLTSLEVKTAIKKQVTQQWLKKC